METKRSLSGKIVKSNQGTILLEAKYIPPSEDRVRVEVEGVGMEESWFFHRNNHYVFFSREDESPSQIFDREGSAVSAGPDLRKFAIQHLKKIL